MYAAIIHKLCIIVLKDKQLGALIKAPTLYWHRGANKNVQLTPLSRSVISSEFSKVSQFRTEQQQIHKTLFLNHFSAF